MKYELSSIEKNIIVCRLDKGDEIFNSLKELINKQNIYGGFFYGIGAVRDIVLSYYDLNSNFTI